MKNHPILSVRNIFQLRKLPSLSSRRTQARVFIWNKQTGLSDTSGCIWPVTLNYPSKENENVTLNKARNENIIEGNDVIIAHLQGMEKGILKFYVEPHIVKAQNPWPNPYVPSPTPKILEEEILKNITETLYFRHPAQERYQRLKTTSQCLNKCQDFFENKGYVHLPTPILVPMGGMEQYLVTFNTQYRDHRGKDIPLQLPTSPEFALKKLFTEGWHKIFQISQSFRNDGELGPQHEPQFTLLEWYNSGGTFEQMMEDTQLLIQLWSKFLHVESSAFQKTAPRFTVSKLMEMHMGFSLADVQEVSIFYEKSKKISPSVKDTDTWNVLFSKVFMEKIEPALKAYPLCFVEDYPIQMGALARGEGIVCKRMEAYLHGIEISNGFEELTDAVELKERAKKDGYDISRDSIFYDTMGFGLPQCVGNALGVERTLMVLSGAHCQVSDFRSLPFMGQFTKGSVAPQ